VTPGLIMTTLAAGICRSRQGKTTPQPAWGRQEAIEMRLDANLRGFDCPAARTAAW
jgi:hypothetical protein